MVFVLFFIALLGWAMPILAQSELPLDLRY